VRTKPLTEDRRTYNVIILPLLSQFVSRAKVLQALRDVYYGIVTQIGIIVSETGYLRKEVN
jgi:hypothetical protein